MGPVTDDSREDVALTDPPEDLDAFPAAPLAGQDWYRAHTVNRGPWWFSHAGNGRFDLEPPDGTCYLGSSVETAVRERLGPTLSRANQIPTDEANGMVVSRLHAEGTAADTTAQEASRFGVTRELSTTTPYDLPQRWARALHGAGYDGLTYWPRFSPGSAQHALALFGAAGADSTQPTDPAPMAGPAAARHANVTVVGVPRSLDTVHPPGPRQP